jgi:hypothetical protein
MTLLTTAQLAAIQSFGRKSMTIDCDIYKRQPFSFDDSNPFGDDTVTYADTAVTVKGWLVPVDSVDFSTDIMQVISAGNFVLRVPVGTDVDPRDRLVIGGKTYYCSESAIEESWPEWITVRLRRKQ